MAVGFALLGHERGSGHGGGGGGVGEWVWTVLFEDNLPVIAIFTSAARR